MCDMRENNQQSLFDVDVDIEEEITPPPSDKFAIDSNKRALDELFSTALQFKKSQDYRSLIEFISKFPFYSPFNAMLVRIQKPGAEFFMPAHRWLNEYRRVIKPGSQPLVILQPMGPVMFVFDVSDTEPLENAPHLPKSVENPFGVTSGKIDGKFDRLLENVKRDGIRLATSRAGSQSAGSIASAAKGIQEKLVFQSGIDEQKNPVFHYVPVLYNMTINENLSKEAKFATIVHELAHLYCGHLGTPDPKWWPDRRGLSYTVREFEAESVTYLVCTRAGLDNPSAEYLSSFFNQHDDTPQISLDCVMKSAGYIENICNKKMQLRK
jgi:hypothetical protein